MDSNGDIETVEDRINDTSELHFMEKGVRTDHIGITLKELPVSPLLRSIGTPNRLYLEATEREGNFIAVLHHIAGKGHREVVA